MAVRYPILPFALVLTAIGIGPRLSAAEAPVKLSEYDGAEFCDLAVDGDGTIHAIFNEQPKSTKAHFVYYRTSKDGGKTWSESLNLSDDESGHKAGYPRLFFDGQGRLYAAWKYVAAGNFMDGPGGASQGRLVYRCWDGKAWSKRIPLGDDKVPTYSWFHSVSSTGDAYIVWSQVAKDAVDAKLYTSSDHANAVRVAKLNGEKPAVDEVIRPKPLMTKDEQDKIRATGKTPKNEDTHLRPEGFINLRGAVDSKGVVRFVGEQPGTESATTLQTGRRITVWDGAKLSVFAVRPKSSSVNLFHDPTALFVDSKGGIRLLRAPEKGEKASLREYAVTGAELGEPTVVFQAKTATGTIRSWQSQTLADGRIAAMAAISQKGGDNPPDTEIFVSYSAGDGKWTEPVSATPRPDKPVETKDEKENPIPLNYEYQPRFASVATDKKGKPILLFVNDRNSIAAMSGRGSNGQRVTIPIPSTSQPAVFFIR